MVHLGARVKGKWMESTGTKLNTLILLQWSRHVLFWLECGWTWNSCFRKVESNCGIGFWLYLCMLTVETFENLTQVLCFVNWDSNKPRKVSSKMIDLVTLVLFIKRLLRKLLSDWYGSTYVWMYVHVPRLSETAELLIYKARL